MHIFARIKQPRMAFNFGVRGAVFAVLLVIAGCAQQPQKGKFDVIDNRPVPQSFVYNNESYTIVSKGAPGSISSVEVTGMAYVLTDSAGDRLKAEQVGSGYLAHRGHCGSGVAPFPVFNSHAYNKKHEFWTISYTCP